MLQCGGPWALYAGWQSASGGLYPKTQICIVIKIEGLEHEE
jgi:hypothetical protein